MFGLWSKMGFVRWNASRKRYWLFGREKIRLDWERVTCGPLHTHKRCFGGTEEYWNNFSLSFFIGLRFLSLWPSPERVNGLRILIVKPFVLKSAIRVLQVLSYHHNHPTRLSSTTILISQICHLYIDSQKMQWWLGRLKHLLLENY